MWFIAAPGSAFSFCENAVRATSFRTDLLSMLLLTRKVAEGAGGGQRKSLRRVEGVSIATARRYLRLCNVFRFSILVSHQEASNSISNLRLGEVEVVDDL